MFGIKNGISTFSIENKKELLQALTDKETLRKILAQGAKAHAVSEYIKSYLRENRTPILEYSMRIKDMVTADKGYGDRRRVAFSRSSNSL
jgi:hypothetical protein